METYIVRVWLPDRPGALGDVAARIGSVDGEIVGIDILERGGGRAIDELAVQLPGTTPLTVLLRSIGSLDGVDVEDIRRVDGAHHDPRGDALETAAVLVGASTRSALLEAVVTHGRRVLGAAWAGVIDLDGGGGVAVDGPAPSVLWLAAFVEGSRSSAQAASGASGPDDVVWAPLPGANLAVVMGRAGSGFRARERRQVAALARIADRQLVGFAKKAHPSTRR